MTADRKYLLKRTNLHYEELGHRAGDILWWADNGGKIRTCVSTGDTFHHDVNRRMNMDARWRGRIEPATRRASLLPPLGRKLFYDDGAGMWLKVPRRLVARLKRRGARTLWCALGNRLWAVLENGKLR
mgnify:CR=1 FL=1